MTHEPPRRPRSGPVPPQPPTPTPAPNERDRVPDDEAEVPSSDRPTLNPPFDVEAFARAATASPNGSAWSTGGGQPPETPTARPPPPVPDAKASGERITLTNEVELEKALAKSRAAERIDTPVGRRAPPPHYSSSSALSIANAQAPSAANIPAARAPSPANIPAARAPSPSPSSIEAAVLGAIGNPGPEITERTIEDPIAEMRERFSLGDYTGALEMAELILTEDPSDPEATECAASCRSVLEGMYVARLGPLDRIPSVIVQRAQLRWLSIDHRAGFVLSLIDGASTLEMILDVCGMPKLDAMRILYELVQQKIVSLRG